MAFLSTPSARRATSQQKFNRRSVYISIHALCEEGDHWTVGTMVTTTRFLSTPSARRATLGPQRKRRKGAISIHALCEEGDQKAREQAAGHTIFLSTPSARRATLLLMVLTSFMVFLSTPSARRATRCGRPDGLSAAISIHALREEGDISSRPLMIPNNKFLSTPSARRATIRKGVIP